MQKQSKFSSLPILS